MSNHTSMSSPSNFRDRVYEIVAHIPTGRVMTYGDIAVRAGSPLSSRIVGTVAHYGPADLPWHRVVNRFGGLASGYPGGREAQKAMLMSEGVSVDESLIVEAFEALRWQPETRADS